MLQSSDHSHCIAAADFTQLTSSVTFSAGATSGMELCFTFNLNEDLILEGHESFNVFISDFGGAQIGAFTSGTFTIQDNDGEYSVVPDSSGLVVAHMHHSLY